jgi:hypothetical protein
MRVLFFSFQQDILVHSLPEAMVAKSLQKSGHEVAYLTCEKVFSGFCINMAASGLTYNSSTEDKKKICTRCIEKKTTLIKTLNPLHYTLDQYLSQKDTELIDGLINSLNKEKIEQFEYNKFPIGRFAAYEFVISHKLNNLQNLPDGLFEEYKIHLKNCLIVRITAEKVLKSYLPDIVIMYNNFYSVNRVFTDSCDLLGIDSYTIHAGHHIKDRLNTLYLAKKYIPYILLSHSDEWKEVKCFPLNKKRIDVVAKHFIELFAGDNAFVYSAPVSKISKRELLAYFDIKEDKKVILMILTSADERYAASLLDVMPDLVYEKIYSSQIEWVSDIISRFKDRNGIEVIIRPHPREFPNKREGISSSHGIVLKKIFENLPDNFSVNWPSDKIAIYDLAKIVDFCLTSTSTSGLEMATLGIPIVTFSPDNTYSYPASDITYSSTNKEEYYYNIEETMTRPWSIEYSRMAFRWNAFRYCDFDINLKDVLKVREGKKLSIPERIINKVKFILGVNISKKIKILLPKEHESICKTLENHENFHLKKYISNENNFELETKYIKRTIEQLHKKLGITKMYH